MNGKTRIKVDKAKLIAALEAKQVATYAAYDADKVRYKKELTAWNAKAETDHRKAVVAHLTAVGKHVLAHGTEADGEFLSRYHGVVLPDKAEKPRAPREPRSLATAIAQLEMAADPTVTISGEDFAAYMN